MNRKQFLKIMGCLCLASTVSSCETEEGPASPVLAKEQIDYSLEISSEYFPLADLYLEYLDFGDSSLKRIPIKESAFSLTLTGTPKQIPFESSFKIIIEPKAVDSFPVHMNDASIKKHMQASSIYSDGTIHGHVSEDDNSELPDHNFLNAEELSYFCQNMGSTFASHIKFNGKGEITYESWK